MSNTTLDKLKKLEAEASVLRKQATREAMATVKGALAFLNSLGVSYGLIEKPKKAKAPAKGKAKKASVKRQRDPNAVCKICGEKGHDARRHRWDKVKAKKK